jgi:hypothetical protein
MLHGASGSGRYTDINCVCVIHHKYNPSGVFSVFWWMTASLAAAKSALLTRILLSLKARRPASAGRDKRMGSVYVIHLCNLQQRCRDSLHTALMSAPDRSSLVMINSSKSTSSANDILDVCNLKMCRLVLVSGMGNSVVRRRRRDVNSGLQVRDC